MTSEEKLEAVIRLATELPDEAQAELFRSLVEMRSQNLGIYNPDEEIDAPLTRRGA